MMGLAGGAAFGPQALADECWPECERVYRAIDLGPIGDSIALGLPFLRDLTFGINRHGDVVWFVYESDPFAGEKIRSFVRLTKAKFGLQPLTAYELLPPSDLVGRTAVVATAINDDGWIAGYVGDEPNLTFVSVDDDEGARAVVWRLFDADTNANPPLIPAQNVHPIEVQTTTPTETSCSSALHAINNDPDPLVGGRVRMKFCPTACGEFPPSVDWPIGFTRRVNPLGGAWGHPGTTGAPSVALDVNTPEAPSLPVTVGYDTRDGDACPPVLPEPTSCTTPDNPRDGLLWGFSNPIPVVLDGLDGALDTGSERARGIADDGFIVGSTVVPIGVAFQCQRRAVGWSSPTTVLNLHDVCGLGDLSSQAEAVTTAANVQPAALRIAVGGEDVFSRGYVWFETSAGPWCCQRFDDVATSSIPDVPTNQLRVRYGHAVAPTGQVVADASIDTGGFPAPIAFPRAVLLTCFHDFNGDFRVDGAELGMLLNAWGPVGEEDSGDFDFDCNGVVDGADLGILLLAWTVGDEPCAIGEHSGLDCGCVGAEAMASGDGALVDAALHLAGFPTADGFVEWGLSASPEQLESVALFVRSILVAIEPATE